MPGQPGGLTIGVLGGTGFLGSRLAARLSNAGCRLRIPTRSLARNRHLLVLPQVQLIHADVHDPAILSELLSGCDVAVNLVGILNERGRDGAGFHHVHTELTGKLIDACRVAGVGKLVQISALKANAETGPSHYLRSKGEAERLIVAAEDLAWTILQPSVIFGPGDSFLNRFAGLLRQIPLVFPLARPDSRFAPVHVDDVTAAIAKVITDPDTNGQTYQLGGPRVYTLEELVRMIAAEIGVRRFVLRLPDSLARLQAVIMERLPGKVFSMDNYRSLTVHNVCTEDGFEALQIKPRSLERNLAACLTEIRARTPLDSYRRASGR